MEPSPEGSCKNNSYMQAVINNISQKDEIMGMIEGLKQSDLLKVLNCSYVAERFFGKSGSWFSQKINGHMKNGKPAEFTPGELHTLGNALYTLSTELAEIADELP